MKKNTKTALVVALFPITIAILFVWSTINEGEQKSPIQTISLYPKAKIVANFSLVTSNSKKFTNDALTDHFSLVFFGYTHCPDVCPTTMANLSKVYKGLKLNDKNKLNVLFVSVDPKRDKPKNLEQYVHYFDPAFQFATGEESELLRMAKSMGALFIINKADEQGNYEVDHTSKVFLLNPQAELIGMFDGQIIPPATKYPFKGITQDLKYLIEHTAG